MNCLISLFTFHYPGNILKDDYQIISLIGSGLSKILSRNTRHCNSPENVTADWLRTINILNIAH